MHFDIIHTIASVDLGSYERLYFDEPFNEALCQELGLGRRLVRLSNSGLTIVREVEVVAHKEVPTAVRKILGDKSVAYNETITYNTATHSGTWFTASSVMADKISSRGDLMMASHGTGVQRRVRGDVVARFFGLGSVVERFIVADVEKSYQRAAQFTERYLRALL